MKKGISVKSLLLTFTVGVLAGCASYPSAKKVNTRQGEFIYQLTGTSTPTVVFESGLSDDMQVWQSVTSVMDKKIQTFSYNRAGFTGSESYNSNRSGEVIVAELRETLKSLGLLPPYVLVGHSLGGAYMELYTRLHPEEVAGLVLIDPNSAKYPVLCAQAKLNYCDPPSDIPWWASLFLPDAVTGEIRGFAETHNQINAISSFPDIPVATLQAKSSGRDEVQQELYTRALKQLSDSVSNSKYISCDKCSHYIQRDKPELVVNAIDWVIATNAAAN